VLGLLAVKRYDEYIQSVTAIAVTADGISDGQLARTVINRIGDAATAK